MGYSFFESVSGPVITSLNRNFVELLLNVWKYALFIIVRLVKISTFTSTRFTELLGFRRYIEAFFSWNDSIVSSIWNMIDVSSTSVVIPFFISSILNLLPSFVSMSNATNNSVLWGLTGLTVKLKILV